MNAGLLGLSFGTAEVSATSGASDERVAKHRFGGRRGPPAELERPTDYDAVADAMRTGTQFDLHVALKRARWFRLRPALAACAALLRAVLCRH